MIMSTPPDVNNEIGATKLGNAAAQCPLEATEPQLRASIPLTVV